MHISIHWREIVLFGLNFFLQFSVTLLNPADTWIFQADYLQRIKEINLRQQASNLKKYWTFL